jgi:hypothetical protein
VCLWGSDMVPSSSQYMASPLSTVPSLFLSASVSQS